MILLVTLIIAALAVYLTATILELIKITNGLDVVINGVGEIVAKTAPVNGVVDAINTNLVTGRDLLETLLLKKAGPDSAGLVESLFPGEGKNFLRRVGRSGKVVNVGTVYTRGVGILAGLGRGAPIGAAHEKGPAVRDPQYSTTAASMLYPRPGGARARPKSPVVGSDAPTQYEPTSAPGVRPGRESESGDGGEAPETPTGEAPDMPTGGAPDMPTGQGEGQQAQQPAAAEPQPEPDTEPEPEPEPPPEPESAAPPPADAGGGDSGGGDEQPPGRMNLRGSRPWER
ncbi:MAG: hypothetical protein M3401_04045 [Actinomycetota bacterium]|nr:hypothetical protein [Actinomycetota bacterium]